VRLRTPQATRRPVVDVDLQILPVGGTLVVGAVEQVGAVITVVGLCRGATSDQRLVRKREDEACLGGDQARPKRCVPWGEGKGLARDPREARRGGARER
jgi:hypothetical protein